MRSLRSVLAALLATSSLAACATDPGLAAAGQSAPSQSAPSQAAAYQSAPNPAGDNTRLSDAQRAQLYRDHAGAPIDGFVGRVNDWTSLDEHSLAVWTGPNRGYLLEVMGPCIELPWAQQITFSKGAYSGVKVYDDVIVLGRPTRTMPCTIREIRPIDAKAVKRARAS
jgi:hypothetical protein